MYIQKIIHKIDSQTDIKEYILQNKHGMIVKILSYGATIKEINLPNSDKSIENIVLSFQNKEQYRNNPLYCGAVLGPNAGRIANAQLPVDDKIYPLSTNDGRHNLHGGFHNISFMNWKELYFYKNNSAAFLTLSTFLPDGTDGFPGNRRIQVTYELREDDQLFLNFSAHSDKPTYFNLSNHIYFNLSGNFEKSALDQFLECNASYYTHNNKEHISTEICSVKNTPFDFQIITSLNEQINQYSTSEQLSNSEGFNHGLVCNLSSLKNISHMLTLWDKCTSRKMHLYSDAPCVVLYSGGYIDTSYLLHGASHSSKSCAIALEAQDLPNSPWGYSYPYTITPKNSLYTRTICYRFDY